MFAANHKKTLFPRFLRSLLIAYVITLSLEKDIIIVVEKKSGKSLEFWIHKSVQTLNFALNKMSVQIVLEFHLASQTIHVYSCNKINKSVEKLTHLPLSLGWGGGVLPYMGYIGMCRCEGYGFQAVYSRIPRVYKSECLGLE